MQVALLADLHLGSKTIGDSRWRLEALQNVIVPKLRELRVTHIIFPGDTLDFSQGGLTSRTAERPKQLQAAAEFIHGLGVPCYLLLGNHDDEESCTFFEGMGGPKIVQNDWVELREDIGAFFMPGRRDKEASIEALQLLDVCRFKKKILILHEDLPIFHDPGFLDAAQARFDLIVNGHNHVYRAIRPKVYLLPACLPWDARRGSHCDLKVHYLSDGQITRESNLNAWGFTVFDEDLVLHMQPVEPGVRIAICNVEAPANKAGEAIRATLDSLLSDQSLPPKALVVRTFFGPRLPRAVRAEMTQAYADRFLDLGIEEWQGSGTVARDLRTRLPTEESALETVRSLHGDKAREMIEQLADLFHLKNPAYRKDDILRIVRTLNEEGSDREATDSAKPGSPAHP